jgi:hypothetical protein
MPEEPNNAHPEIKHEKKGVMEWWSNEVIESNSNI